MPRLPRVISTKAIKALEKLGFVKVRQKGSHVIMKKQLSDRDNTQIGCVVPPINQQRSLLTVNQQSV